MMKELFEAIEFLFVEILFFPFDFISPFSSGFLSSSIACKDKENKAKNKIKNFTCFINNLKQF